MGAVADLYDHIPSEEDTEEETAQWHRELEIIEDRLDNADPDQSRKGAYKEHWIKNKRDMLGWYDYLVTDVRVMMEIYEKFGTFFYHAYGINIKYRCTNAQCAWEYFVKKITDTDKFRPTEASPEDSMGEDLADALGEADEAAADVLRSNREAAKTRRTYRERNLMHDLVIPTVEQDTMIRQAVYGGLSMPQKQYFKAADFDEGKVEYDTQPNPSITGPPTVQTEKYLHKVCNSTTACLYLPQHRWKMCSTT